MTPKGQPPPIAERHRRRAEKLLKRIWQDMVGQLIDECVDNEESLAGQGFSFSYQGIEDRFAQRLFMAGQMIGAVQSAAPRRPRPPPEFRVVRIEGPLEELDQRINERLRDLPGHEVHGLEIVSDDDETWHAFLTVSGA